SNAWTEKTTPELHEYKLSPSTSCCFRKPNLVRDLREKSLSITGSYLPAGRKSKRGTEVPRPSGLPTRERQPLQASTDRPERLAAKGCGQAVPPLRPPPPRSPEGPTQVCCSRRQPRDGAEGAGQPRSTAPGGAGARSPWKVTLPEQAPVR